MLAQALPELLEQQEQLAVPVPLVELAPLELSHSVVLVQSRFALQAEPVPRELNPP